MQLLATDNEVQVSQSEFISQKTPRPEVQSVKSKGGAISELQDFDDKPEAKTVRRPSRSKSQASAKDKKTYKVTSVPVKNTMGKGKTTTQNNKQSAPKSKSPVTPKTPIVKLCKRG